ncbi:hypothetical protein BO71DRAFT_439211 [Aspergillus ellipticus CBS 707.79]|uniref:Zn(II)2Cys6 transcription factor n=1 Tax=Aspergillus ellipticus CBS 707.79 TaxID=1448320 RepID=A0A319DHM4_9EURO|nr:hypothetical protein BO71DRAFT_439211 [Aspergillus ellipticus CBS 707.79]
MTTPDLCHVGANWVLGINLHIGDSHLALGPPNIRGQREGYLIGCDQQLPQCGQCTRMREQCCGYRDEWELVFRDQTKHTIKRSKEKSAKKAAAGMIGAHRPAPPAGMPPSLDEIGVNYFLHNFVISNQSPSRGFLNYVPAVFSADAEHPTLVASMAAVGLVALANSSRQPDLIAHARVKYSEAIRNVNSALASPVDCVKDSTLMSIISLGVFEHVSNFRSWVRHVQGAAALVVVRGRKQFSSPAAIFMFNQVRADMVIACLHGNQPFPEDLRKLQEDAAMHTDTSIPLWQLGVTAVRCANLLYGVSQNKGEIPWYNFLEEATVLQRDFQRILGILAVQEPYTTVRNFDGDPNMIHNGRYDLYRSSWAIRVWNNSRNIQIIACEIGCHILNKVLAAELPPVVRESMKVRLHDTLEILSKLADDMLATVPQTLGYVTIRSTSGNDCSPASVSGSYILVWSLYMVGKSVVITGETRKWIIQRLQEIGQSAGLTMVLPLLEQIIKLDQLADQKALTEPHFEPARD